jgi:hypothetical protein
MTTILLLAIIAATLVWALVLRPPFEQWRATRAQRRRVLAASLAADLVAQQRPVSSESLTLLLVGPNGEPEHEITRHGAGDAPEAYAYANKDYERTEQRADGAWLYRRVLVALLLLLVAPRAFAQGTAVTIRSSAGTELATSAAPVRTDPTGSTTQPVSGTVTANQGGAPWSVSQSGNWLVQGLVAHDAVYSGNPLPLGCYSSTAAPTNTGADGNIARLWCLRNGALSVTFTNSTIAVTNAGTFATQSAITAASGSIASGAIASGAVASGAYASGSVSDGAIVALGVTTDAAVGDATGTVNAHLRQVAKLFSAVAFGDVNNVASAAGLLNTIPVGRYDLTQPTLTSGRWSAQQLSSRGELFIAKGVSGFLIDNSSFAATQSGTWTVQPGNTANTTAWKVDGSAVTQPVSISGNQAVNVAQLAGTTTDTNSGNKSAGTLRVVLATDQPALTNKLLVTPDANSAVNLAQIAGTTTVNGGLAGSQAIGGTAATNATINQNPVLIGAETVGIGTLPTAATAANQRQLVSDIYGNQFVRLGSSNQGSVLTAALSTTDTQVVAAPAAGLSVWLTAIVGQSTTSTAATTTLEYGTGSNCATGKTTIISVQSSANTGNPFSLGIGSIGLAVPAAKALCLVNSSATNTANVWVTYYVAP